MSETIFYKSEIFNCVVKTDKKETVRICGLNVSHIDKSIWGDNNIYEPDKNYERCTEAEYHNALIKVKEFLDRELENAVDVTEKINYSKMCSDESMYPVIYTFRQNGEKIFAPHYAHGKDLTEPQIKYLYESGYFKNNC